MHRPETSAIWIGQNGLDGHLFNSFSDVSYELQPPGLTTFFLLSQPTTGGDTLFTSQISTLKKLSPQFIAFLRTLKAVHSGVEQANYSRSGKRGGVVRREPVENIHPVVRKHPVTGEEALYVNRQFTKRIVGLKKEESGECTSLRIEESPYWAALEETLLNFIYSHIAASGDLQARLHWSPNTVAIWDNRSTFHTATYASFLERWSLVECIFIGMIIMIFVKVIVW